jgi:hypothetical protein
MYLWRGGGSISATPFFELLNSRFGEIRPVCDEAFLQNEIYSLRNLQ